jgi:hypothetical protein
MLEGIWKPGEMRLLRTLTKTERSGLDEEMARVDELLAR